MLAWGWSAVVARAFAAGCAVGRRVLLGIWIATVVAGRSGGGRVGRLLLQLTIISTSFRIEISYQSHENALCIPVHAVLDNPPAADIPAAARTVPAVDTRVDRPAAGIPGMGTVRAAPEEDIRPVEEDSSLVGLDIGRGEAARRSSPT